MALVSITVSPYYIYMGSAIHFITPTFVVLSLTVGLFGVDAVSTAWRQISTFTSCNA